MELKKRDSRFEIMRLFAQFLIIFYHVLVFLVQPSYCGKSDTISLALWIPLHIGVPIFVLISGYFGIHPSVRGFVNLVTKVAVLFIPLFTFNLLAFDDGLSLSNFLIISHTQYWFVRTYIYLYLVSPVLNLYIKNSSDKSLLYILSILAFINIYIGFFNTDPSLVEGKNLINFAFLYFIGAFLRKYEWKWRMIPVNRLFLLYLMLNFAECWVWNENKYNAGGGKIWRLCFMYNSIMLIFNSVLVFCMIAHSNLQSKTLNRIAKSSFAIYLIHCHIFIVNHIHVPCVNYISERFDTPIFLLLALLTYSVIVFCTCIVIDQLLSPLWNFVDKIGAKLEKMIVDHTGNH